MSRNRLLSSSIVALLATSALACVLEWGLRAYGFEYPPDDERPIAWSRETDRAMRDGSSAYRLDDSELWTLRAGGRLPGWPGERVNRDGYRGPTIPVSREPGVLRIVTLGGTAACGRGVAYDDAYPARLQQALSKRGVRCEVQCGAVENTTIAQGLQRYRRRFRAFEPDVVISAFSGDEEHDPAPGAVSDFRRIAAGRAATSCGGLARALRRESRAVQLPVWIARAVGGSYWRERADDFEARRACRDAGLCDAPIVRRVAPDEFDDALRMLDEEVWRDGARLILVSIPRTLDERSYCGAVEAYDDELREFGERHGVPYVSCRDLLRHAAIEGTRMQELANDEHAIAECMHDRLGEALAREILAWRGDVVR
jgi:hypothetical protein